MHHKTHDSQSESPSPTCCTWSMSLPETLLTSASQWNISHIWLMPWQISPSSTCYYSSFPRTPIFATTETINIISRWNISNNFPLLCQESKGIELVMSVCLCGFVRPTLCTTSWVQDYVVQYWPALCTTRWCCAPWCTKGTYDTQTAIRTSSYCTPSWTELITIMNVLCAT